MTYIDNILEGSIDYGIDDIECWKERYTFQICDERWCLQVPSSTALYVRNCTVWYVVVLYIPILLPSPIIVLK